jgi:hypothetical protein
VPSIAAAQTTPLPLPAEPGGARPPVYTQPPPTPPIRTEPPPVAAPSVPAPGPVLVPSEPPPREEQKAEGSKVDRGKGDGIEGDATKPPPKPRVPQVTSFPELTRGVGDSDALLKE